MRQGRSRGWRTVIAYRQNDRALIFFGFAKSARANVDETDIEAGRRTASTFLAMSEKDIDEMAAADAYVEVPCVDGQND